MYFIYRNNNFIGCGKTIEKSCELGIKYVNQAIRSNPKYGKGKWSN